VGEYLRLKAVRMPDLHMRHRQYRAICDWCASHGFERVSVWGFKRGTAPRYSSVTRDGYIGIGPGAGSHLPDGFTVNTFDLAAWVHALDAPRRSRWRCRSPATPAAGGCTGVLRRAIPLTRWTTLWQGCAQGSPLWRGGRSGLARRKGSNPS
jgi:hypothetical protein